MNIWTVTVNDDGGIWTAAYLTEEAAEEACREWVSKAWAEHKELPMPEDWREAFGQLTDLAGFLDWILPQEHDLAALRPPPRKGAWSHAVSLAVEVFSDDEQAEDLTDAQIIEAFRRELDKLERRAPLSGTLRQTGAIDIFDTMAAEEDDE